MIKLSSKPLNPPRVVNQLMQTQPVQAILATSMSLAMFDALDDGFISARDVADRIGIQPRAAELMLNTLVGIGLIEKKEGQFKNSEEAHHYLTRKSPLYMGRMFGMRSHFVEVWQNLENVAKSGTPFNEVNQEEKAEQFFPELAAALFPLNYGFAQKLADALSIAKFKGEVRVLDLACGSAVWSIPMAQASENVRVDALDFPAVLERTAAEFTQQCGVSERYRYLSGNWTGVRLEDSVYDIVVLGHILHSEGKARSAELLACVYKAMKKGATLAIAEFLVDETRTQPARAAAFGVNMYLLTTEGCVFSFNELKEMLADAGFSNVRPLAKEETDADIVLADK